MCITNSFENEDVGFLQGKPEGNLTVAIYPCDNKGKIFEDDYCEDPDELLGKPFHFKVLPTLAQQAFRFIFKLFSPKIGVF